MEPLHRDDSYFHPYHKEIILQPSLEPNDAPNKRCQDLYDYINGLGCRFSNINRFFEDVHNPYEDVDNRNLAFVVLHASTWIREF